jgi:hypothetical protein
MAWFQSPQSLCQKKCSLRSRSKQKLTCESLEDRRVLATFTVINTADAGAGSLRQAILDSNAAAGADTIDFAAAVQGATINLTSGQLTVTDDLLIDASAGARVTVSGNNTFRIFKVDDSTAMNKTVEFNNLQIQNGNANLEPWADNFVSRRGGGIDNRENFTLRNSVVRQNSGRRGGGVSSAGTASNAAGARGSITIVDSTISGNTSLNDDACAVALCDDDPNTAAPVPNRSGGRGAGLGLFNNSGPATITNSTIEGNVGPSLAGGIDVSLGVNLTINGSTLQGNGTNAGGSGGAMHINNFATPLLPTVVNINNTNIRNNSVAGGDFSRGGGLYIAGGNAGAPVTVTITGGVIEGNTTDKLGGAASLASGARLIINNATIRNNTAAERGGAMYTSLFANVAGLVTETELNNVIVTGNSSTGLATLSAGQGAKMTIRNSTIEANLGNIAAVGAYSSTVASTLDIEDSIIRNNEGGGIEGTIFSGGTAQTSFRLVDSTISGNGFLPGNVRNATTGSVGIGLYNALNAVVSGSTISGNYSQYAGAAMETGGSATVLVENTTISGNISANFSGGTFSNGNSVLTIRRSTISGNVGEATAGGIFVGDNATVNLQQSTLSGNTTAGSGGGALVYGDSGYTATLNVDFSTITANSSDTDNDGGAGGGLYVAAYADPNGVANGNAVVTITNSIVSGNTDPSAQGPDLFDYKAYYGGAAGYTTAKFTFIGNNENSGIAEANPDANGNIVGGSIGGVLNANLGPLANNGGSTQTHLPNAGSPVINKADPATPAGTDQRGQSRVVDGRADMGSVEVSGGPDADFNDDGLLNCADIDALTTAVATGGSVATFDLNGDAVLSILDVDKWRADAGAVNIGAGRVYRVGDANLDGSVDGSDFGLWNSNKFTANKNWCQGNFNADSFTDGSDFGLWNANKFTSSDAGRVIDGNGNSSVADFTGLGSAAESARVRQGGTKLPGQVRHVANRIAASQPQDFGDEKSGGAQQKAVQIPVASPESSRTNLTKSAKKARDTYFSMLGAQ